MTHDDHEVVELDVSGLSDAQLQALAQVLNANDVPTEWDRGVLRVPNIAAVEARDALSWARAEPQAIAADDAADIARPVGHRGLRTAATIAAIMGWLCGAGSLFAILSWWTSTPPTAGYLTAADLTEVVGITSETEIASALHGSVSVDALRVEITTTGVRGRITAVPILLGTIGFLAIASHCWFLVRRVLLRLSATDLDLSRCAPDLRALGLWVGIALPVTELLVAPALRAVALSRLAVGVDVVGWDPSMFGGLWAVWIVLGLISTALAKAATPAATA